MRRHADCHAAYAICRRSQHVIYRSPEQQLICFRFATMLAALLCLRHAFATQQALLPSSTTNTLTGASAFVEHRAQRRDATVLRAIPRVVDVR